MTTIKKILLLGSGAIKIGEAGEFDYSGSQAIKAIKEEGIKVILVNPNIATVQTSKEMADEVYFLPVTSEFVTKIIIKERPDAILLSFGGQTALNCGMALHKQGILKKYKVEILGTPIEAILATEDRALFAKRLMKLGVHSAKGNVATSVAEALAIGNKIGYPVMLRSGFALGGAGSGIVTNSRELSELAQAAFSVSPQVIVEESLYGWKEIEYEVVRDKDDNCITVCNMENFDPVGIHTGESIVIAPSQTLTNNEYYYLRQKAIDIIRDLKIIGECNIQYALNPESDEVRVIEVNARLSRSSALASKATGYPLAYVAAKLALGKTLPELPNKVTQKTSAFFEPSLDYVVVKFPRWDLDKFVNVDTTISSEMKSVGEVMSIGKTFEEAIQKAARMLNDGYKGVIDTQYNNETKNELLHKLQMPTSTRLFTICSALYVGITVEEIHERTFIDRWFLSHLSSIVEKFCELQVLPGDLTPQVLRSAKEMGFSDKQIADITHKQESDIRKTRKRLGIIPYPTQIDTTAGEFPAVTNYLYLTYHATTPIYSPNNDKESVIVLGCGPYSIGTSVEFDWSAVNTVLSLRMHNKHSIMINCNPETVSTDFDVSDTLYFEELTLERVMDIYDVETSPIIVSVGGQIANNLASKLHEYGVSILGTHPRDINRAEDRKKFSSLLDRLNILQPAWSQCFSVKQVLEKVKVLGFPLMVRPSFVLSGRAMSIIEDEDKLEHYLDSYPMDIQEYPLVISKFLRKATECDVDGVAYEGTITAIAISEHVEEAGVHSGDSTLIFPTVTLSESMRKTIEDQSAKIVKSLHIHGPYNIQYLIADDRLYVIECNVRASRSMPFVSKAMDKNLIFMASNVLLGVKVVPLEPKTTPFFTVKVPQFSYHKLKGADPVPRVEMTSTGEVAAMGKTVEEAYLKAILATGFHFPQKKAVCISLGGAEAKLSFLSSCQALAALGWKIYATSGTSLFLKEYEIPVSRVGKIYEGVHPNINDLLSSNSIDFMVNISDTYKKKDKAKSDGYVIRRMSIDCGIPVFSNLNNATLFVKVLTKYDIHELPIEPWSSYISM